MNKKEAIEELEENKRDCKAAALDINYYKTTALDIRWNAALNVAIDIVKQINEPEKPIVPQFVADFYESIKDDFKGGVYELCAQFYEDESESSDGLYWWFKFSANKPIQTLVNMHQFGYEVKKEKLYTVEIPNPNEYNGGNIVLVKKENGICIDCYYNNYHKKLDRAKLTEAEIKKDFDWAWQFAKEVEEND